MGDPSPNPPLVDAPGTVTWTHAWSCCQYSDVQNWCAGAYTFVFTAYVGEIMVQAASVLFFMPPSSDSMRVRPHIRFRRCMLSVDMFHYPFWCCWSAIWPVPTASISSCRRRCSTTYSTTYHSRRSSYVAHWSFAFRSDGVTLDSDDISSSHVAVVIVRRLHRLAMLRIVLFYLQTFEHYFCVNHHHHHRRHRVCITLFWYYMFITATLSLIIPLVITI